MLRERGFGRHGLMSVQRVPAKRLRVQLFQRAPSGRPCQDVSPVSAAIPADQLKYDAHGNTTTLADQTLGYDVSDQHVKTALSDGTRVEYLRDVTGRIVQRTETPGSPTSRKARSGSTLPDLTGSRRGVQSTLTTAPGGSTMTTPPSTSALRH